MFWFIRFCMVTPQTVQEFSEALVQISQDTICRPVTSVPHLGQGCVQAHTILRCCNEISTKRQ